MAADVQLVIFKLANEDYGLSISKVQEINRMVAVTRLPQTPDFMKGIINLRGRIITTQESIMLGNTASA